MFQFFPQHTHPLRRAVTAAYRRDEAQAVAHAFDRIHTTPESREASDRAARDLLAKMQEQPLPEHGAAAFLHAFDPATPEGGAFLELVEALYRIPDADTRTVLLNDKTAIGNWDKILKYTPDEPTGWLQKLTGKSNEPDSHDKTAVRQHKIHKAEQTVDMLAARFIGGKTIGETAKKYKKLEKSGYCFSFALPFAPAASQSEADRNYQEYIEAVHTVGGLTRRMGVLASHNLSIRLSALSPHYRHLSLKHIQETLLPKIKHLFFLAKEYQISLCIEAEESTRLELSLSILEDIVAETMLADYQGIGFTVQAYQKRAPAVIEFLADLAQRYQKRLPVRLVKGSNWAAEIKAAQAAGLNGYPVYTRKEHTDLSYLACAQMLLDNPEAFYPQFATQNPDTVAAICEMGRDREFEFQCLHGLGESLYKQITGEKKQGRRCRIYMPVGEYAEWPAYIVRRINDYRLLNLPAHDDTVSRHPVDAAVRTQGRPHPLVPLPRHIYGRNRLNAIGIDFSDDLVLHRLQELMNVAGNDGFQAVPITLISAPVHEARFVQNPADHNDAIGASAFIREEGIHNVVSAAKVVERHWAGVPVAQRADSLYRVADTLESCLPEMLNLIIREAGKTVADALDEVRRAVDYCRYYAREAEQTCNGRAPLGTVLVISPWHSPLAAFVGQSAAALVAGNTVIAKPAAQTCLTAYRAVQLMHASGIPPAALQLVLGDGAVGAALTRDKRINGVLFNGSTEAAKLINHTLGQRNDLPVLIAETGGQNAMIADSSTDLHQLCRDVLQSAFSSAGQRNAALRLLCVQDEIADKVIEMLRGAMDALTVGNPVDAAVDIGPVIDNEAQSTILGYLEHICTQARSFHQSPLPDRLLRHATFVSPALVELNSIEQLQREIFGPVLHIVRYASGSLNQIIEQINAKGYALACGVHSRSDSRIDLITRNIDAGTIYTNQSMTAAAPGAQPSGGHGLSGTGPKSGATFYLQRLSQGKWKMPALTREATPDSVSLANAEKLIRETGFSHEIRVKLSGLAGQARIHNLRYAQADLDGITGEENLLTWRSPKHIWIDGGSLQNSFAALLQIAAAGMQAVVHTSHPLAGWHTRLNGILRISSHPQQQPFVSHLVALEAPEPSVKMALAARKGAIVRIIDASNGLDILQLFEEVAYSTDTTIGGSNTALQAAVSSPLPEQLHGGAI